ADSDENRGEKWRGGQDVNRTGGDGCPGSKASQTCQHRRTIRPSLIITLFEGRGGKLERRFVARRVRLRRLTTEMTRGARWLPGIARAFSSNLESRVAASETRPLHLEHAAFIRSL